MEEAGARNALLSNTRDVDFGSPDSGFGVGTGKNPTPTGLSKLERAVEAAPSGYNPWGGSFSCDGQLYRNQP
jgi:hypothetical protein